MAFSNLASNQMVSFTEAQSSGFSLNVNQSQETSNKCMTKDETLAKYNLNASLMSTYSSNQLVPKSVWGSGADTTPPTVSTITWRTDYDYNGDGVDDVGWFYTGSTDNVAIYQHQEELLRDGVTVETKYNITSYSNGFWEMGTAKENYYRDTYGSGTYCFRVRTQDSSSNWSDWVNSIYCVTVSAPSVTATSWLTRSGNTEIQSTSGTITISGASATFYAQAIATGTAITNVNITINGISRTAFQNGAGTANSSTFVLGVGTYNYSVTVDIDSGSGQGGIIYTQ